MTSRLLTIVILGTSLFAVRPALAAPDSIPAIQTEDRFTHGTLDSLLRQVVHGERVDYAAVQEQRPLLDRYLGQVAGAKPGQLPTRGDSLAFFINAYNAIVLGFVADRYPEISSVLEEPEGVADFPGFFNQKALVAGHHWNLDELEHKALRGRFREARIHFAISCASISCPPLRDRAYRAAGLEDQLESVTRRFINDPRRNRYDPGTGKLYLSQIFEWFPMDFERASGSVRSFFFAYLDGYGAGRDVPDAEILFLPYDWRLNARER